MLILRILFLLIVSLLSVELNAQVTVGELVVPFAKVINESDDGWKQIEPSGAKFKMWVPGTAKVSHQSVPTEVGNLDMYMYTVEQSNAEAFMIAIADYPVELVPDVEAEEDLEKTVADAGIAGIGGTVEEARYLDIKSGRSRIYEAKGKAEFQGYVIHLYYRVLFNKNRLYQLMWMRDAEYPSTEEVARAFDSFEYLEDQTSRLPTPYEVNGETYKEEAYGDFSEEEPAEDYEATEDIDGFESKYKLPQWGEFSPRGSGFKMEIPGIPKRVEEEINLSSGAAKAMKAYTITGTANSDSIMVAYVDFPEELISNPDLLKEQCVYVGDEFIAAHNAKSEGGYFHKTDNGHFVYDVMGVVSGEILETDVKVRVLFVNNRMIRLTWIGYFIKEFHYQSRKMFDSFEEVNE